MRDLDETDLHILELLSADGRRSYSAIADEVDLSGPAVSDRVERLREAGVIRRFTVDVDSSQLRGGTSVLVDVETTPADVADVEAAMRDAEAVEHVYTTAEASVTAFARVTGAVEAWLRDAVPPELVEDYSVRLVSRSEWTPSVGGDEFALTCAECENTVTSEGESARVGDELYHFCCPSCERQFRERYERLEEGA
jgi:Lrp/AsnC family leucine-responsive transcriptional regulator